jgi:hypothetical protein
MSCIARCFESIPIWFLWIRSARRLDPRLMFMPPRTDGVLESFLYEKQHATKVAWPQSFLRRKVYRCNLSNSEEDVVLVNESFGTSVCVVIVMDLLDSCTILFLHLQHGWRPVEELVQSLRENSLARWLSFSTMIWHLKLLECCGGPQISCHSLWAHYAFGVRSVSACGGCENGNLIVWWFTTQNDIFEECGSIRTALSQMSQSARRSIDQGSTDFEKEECARFIGWLFEWQRIGEWFGC